MCRRICLLISRLSQFVFVLGVSSSILQGASGDVDSAFDAGTFVPGSTSSSVRAMAVQPDGKIIIGGFFTSINGSAHNKLARLNADGSLDASFAPNVNNNIFAIALQADGKIVIGGDFFHVNGTTHNSIARLNADGSVDASFTTNVDGTIHAIILQPDGKILFGGSIGGVNNSNRYNVTRLNADSSLDASFAPAFFDGITSYVYALALQPDNKVLVGGVFNQIGGVPRINLARYNSDGTLDNSFSSIITSTNGDVRSIAFQSDGQILIGGGFSTISGAPRNRLARLNPDGTLDPSLTASGFLDFTAVYAILPQPNGKIVIGGFFLYGTVPQLRNSIARLNQDGVRDTSFNTIFINSGSTEGVFAIASQTDKILIGGQFSGIAGTPPREKIARLINNAAAEPPAISGTVTYGNAVGTPVTRFVSNVLISGAGSPNVSTTTAGLGSSEGTYSLTGFGSGSYTITPSKSTGQNGAITSFDAARVAQFIVGAITFTSAQETVADVSGVGGISSYDAALIARYAASLPPPNGSSGTWIFAPVSVTHASIISDITGEDYSALLMGEVSGNWANTGARPLDNR